MARILIAEARFYAHLNDMLLAGARAAIEAAGHAHDTITLPGALELPAAISLASETGKYDGYVALGVVNSHHYSAAHPSATNKKFVQAFEAANKFRPNFMAVAGYDGMRVIYKALEATKGAGGGDALGLIYTTCDCGGRCTPGAGRSSRHRSFSAENSNLAGCGR